MEATKVSTTQQWLPDEIEHSTCSITMKKRSGRASHIQKHELMKYFEDRPGAFLVSGNSAGDARAKQRVWIELAHKLNGVEGALKPSARWAKYWNDLVLYTKMRAHQAVNGGKDYVNSHSHPSEFDQRLLRIVGKHDLLQAWLVLCDTSTKEEVGEHAPEELNGDFEWSESFDEPVQELRASSSTLQNTVEGISTHNPEMYEEFDELIDDTDAVLLRDSSISIDEGLQRNNENQQIEYVEEFEVVLPKVENISEPSIQDNKRKRRHSRLTNGEINADNSDDTEEDNAISKAISVLGSACHSLAVALDGLAEVIAKHKKRRD